MTATPAVRSAIGFLAVLLGLAALTQPTSAQKTAQERTFPQSKSVVERALKELQASGSGRLPVLDGFTVPGDRPLDRFQRGFYQCSIQVTSTSAGGSLVRVSAKITAWYSDPASSKSGYEVLPSNGRLETDFLDRLQEALVGKPTSSGIAANPAPPRPTGKASVPAPDISAPMPGGSALADAIAASKTHISTPAASARPETGSAADDQAASLPTQRAVVDKHLAELTKEAKGLEEILRNQAHPNNLVAVKKSDTPVLSSPNEGAKVLFLAAAEDEFEMLDKNASWVHVRISGLSRGWILRSSLELPEPSASDTVAAPAAGTVSPEPFQVESEQIASFPGNWEPLRGKTVKIVSVKQTNDNASHTGPAKLDFVRSLFDKEYAELTQAATSTAGVVLIFDSADGGMVATTLPVLQQWKAGTLSDQAFWRRCFLDPPEMFGSSERP